MPANWRFWNEFVARPHKQDRLSGFSPARSWPGLMGTTRHIKEPARKLIARWAPLELASLRASRSGHPELAAGRDTVLTHRSPFAVVGLPWDYESPTGQKPLQTSHARITLAPAQALSGPRPR